MWYRESEGQAGKKIGTQSRSKERETILALKQIVKEAKRRNAHSNLKPGNFPLF